ncbi:MAG: dienelactone hydrolase family protein [Thermoflexales bacterium]|nr:dienelactone hydrolase family protein [Thermoflexales bacterium]MDW8293475.1 dienelactone hydrolase family protein [Anaerolineae bacterium]
MIVRTQTVHTDPNRSGPQGYYVCPDDDKTYPGVVLIQEWWGIEPHIRELAIRLATSGFVVLVPDLYHGKVATEPNDAQRMMMMTLENVERAISEIILALDYLRNDEKVQPKKLGLIGFCMGGYLTYRVAERYPHLGAISPWYGGGYDPKPEDVARIAAPVLAIYGQTDPWIPMEQVRKIESLFKAAGKEATFLVYKAGHAFNNPDHGMYVPEAAKDAWAKAVAFLKQKLA